MLLPISLIFCAYLVGSVCSAVIVSQIFHLPDPRTSGSKNPGATNVLRLSGKFYALMVFLADALKGTLPIVLGQFLHLEPFVLGCVGLAAVIGHVYPIFFHFQGGKGVATALGALIGFHPALGGLVLSTWILIAVFTRYSSLASILSLSLMPAYANFLHDNEALYPLIVITLLVLFKHRENFTRLMNGQETKIQRKTKVDTEV